MKDILQVAHTYVAPITSVHRGTFALRTLLTFHADSSFTRNFTTQTAAFYRYIARFSLET